VFYGSGADDYRCRGGRSYCRRFWRQAMALAPAILLTGLPKPLAITPRQPSEQVISTTTRFEITGWFMALS